MFNVLSIIIILLRLLVWVVCSAADIEQASGEWPCVCIHIHWDAHFPYGPMNFFTTHTHMCIHITWRLLLFVGNMFAKICIFYTILLYNTLPHRFTFRLRLPRLPASCRLAFDSETLRGRPRTSGKTHLHPENSYLQLVFHHPPAAPDPTYQRLVIEPYTTAHT